MVWRKEESMDNQNEKKPTLEEAFTRIEAILTQMEQPEISLEESFSLYQQGVLQLKNCRNHSGRSGKKDADPR